MSKLVYIFSIIALLAVGFVGAKALGAFECGACTEVACKDGDKKCCKEKKKCCKKDADKKCCKKDAKACDKGEKKACCKKKEAQGEEAPAEEEAAEEAAE